MAKKKKKVIDMLKCHCNKAYVGETHRCVKLRGAIEGSDRLCGSSFYDDTASIEQDQQTQWEFFHFLNLT